MPKKNLGRLLLIDGSNLAYRAFGKFDKMFDWKKRPVGLIYGFMKLLQSYIIRFQPTFVVVTFDTKHSKESNFRNNLLGSYKVHRSRINFDVDSFNTQIEVVKKLLKYLNIPMVIDTEGLGHESDDYIGYIALKHYKVGRVTILSSDKDFCQLLRPHIKIFNPFKSVIITHGNCKNIMGYSADECVDYLCLLGDKSDDIPGYKGMGEVKTRKFLDIYKSIANFLSLDDSEFPGIDKDGLEDLYSRNKVLIDTKVALKKYPIKKLPMVYNNQDRIKAKKIFSILYEYRFRSMISNEFINTFKHLKQWKDSE